jgi:hypothetical protein
MQNIENTQIAKVAAMQ